MPKNKILILFAHPTPQRSEVNIPLFRTAQKIQGVTCVDLYAEYPNYRIKIDKEQRRLREHDVVVFMFPLYWYSTPAILKEWQDLVLEYGFAYGDDGTALHGKTFFCCVSAGGSEAAYQTEGYNHFTIRELLHPLEQTASLTGMYYLPPFVLYGARTALDEGRLESHKSHLKGLLESLRDNQMDLQKAHHLAKLNDALEDNLAHD